MGQRCYLFHCVPSITRSHPLCHADEHSDRHLRALLDTVDHNWPRTAFITEYDLDLIETQ